MASFTRPMVRELIAAVKKALEPVEGEFGLVLSTGSMRYDAPEPPQVAVGWRRFAEIEDCYSADTISEKQRLRGVVEHGGKLWCITSISSLRNDSIIAGGDELLPPSSKPVPPSKSRSYYYVGKIVSHRGTQYAIGPTQIDFVFHKSDPREVYAYWLNKFGADWCRRANIPKPRDFDSRQLGLFD